MPSNDVVSTKLSPFTEAAFLTDFERFFVCIENDFECLTRKHTFVLGFRSLIVLNDSLLALRAVLRFFLRRGTFTAMLSYASGGNGGRQLVM